MFNLSKKSDENNATLMTLIFAVCRVLKVDPDEFAEEWAKECKSAEYSTKAVIATTKVAISSKRRWVIN